MEIVVRVQSEIARGLQSHREELGAVQALNETVNAFGAQLEPVHPGISDPELQRYFRITGVSPDRADQLVEALGELGGVEAAYRQPPVSPP